MTKAFFNGQPCILVQVLSLEPAQAACADPKTGHTFVVPYGAVKIALEPEGPPQPVYKKPLQKR